jgi:hypothetical protein
MYYSLTHVTFLFFSWFFLFLYVCRGPPKKKQKKQAASCSTENSIIPVAPSRMVFPHNEAVDKATHKKGKRKSSTTSIAKKSNRPSTTTSTTVSTSSRYLLVKFFNIILSYITCHTLLIMTYKTNIQIWTWFQWPYGYPSIDFYNLRTSSHRAIGDHAASVYTKEEDDD